MKKIIFPVSALLVMLMVGCSEDFNVAAPYKPVTIVYGLLDMQDTAHYIRIEKAFLDENKSALVMSQIPDSNFFPVLDVKMKVVNGGAVTNIITLDKVDLNKEGYPKSDTGQFFTSPNYAYKFKGNLDKNSIYRLVIYNPATGETDSAQTPIISEDQNDDFIVPVFQSSSYAIDVSSTILARKFTISGTGPANAVMFQGIIRFHYEDKDLASGAVTRQYADWSFASAATTTSPGNFQLSLPALDFYSGLRDAIGDAATGHGRYLDSSDIFIWAATPDVYTYQQVSITQGNSLTSDEIKPSYTNIKGKNALGLFAARAMIKDTTVGFSVSTIDSFENNPITLPCHILGVTAD